MATDALRAIPQRFRVAFSFAGEQRDLVRQVAEAVEAELGVSSVFFDSWFEHYLAGHDADLKLGEIYASKSDLVVVCVSAEYARKVWPLDEYEEIRARVRLDRVSSDPLHRLSVLPVRVGDGHVPGLPNTVIAPDARREGVQAIAKLILARLDLIEPHAQRIPRNEWPRSLEMPHWPVANLENVLLAFRSLLTSDSPYRYLGIRGDSQRGKTLLTQTLVANVLSTHDIACARFDFKGTADIDGEIDRFVAFLDVGVPPPGSVINRLTHVHGSLSTRRSAALLVFDTFEVAGEASRWMETYLLPSLIRAAWLRVVVAGQSLPDAQRLVGRYAAPVIQLPVIGAAAWFDYAAVNQRAVERGFVEAACEEAGGSSAVLAQLLGPKQ